MIREAENEAEKEGKGDRHVRMQTFDELVLGFRERLDLRKGIALSPSEKVLTLSKMIEKKKAAESKTAKNAALDSSKQKPRNKNQIASSEDMNLNESRQNQNSDRNILLNEITTRGKD